MANEINLTPQKKGDPPLPNAGRPVSAQNIAIKTGNHVVPVSILKTLEEMGIPTTEKRVLGVMFHVLAMKGLSGDVAAIREFLDRRDGKARQDVAVSGTVKTVSDLAGANVKDVLGDLEIDD